MENYAEWNNCKLYEGHVRRLTQIKEKEKKTLRTTKNFRVKSQPAKSQPNIKREFLPLPLVSKNQRLLLGSVVKQKSINLRQKQSLLQNYLLSKRILQTNSVFDSKLLKKQFIFHQKVSDNMNRTMRNNRKTFQEMRNKKYSQLQRIREENYLGVGKVSFRLKISVIMLIKRVLEDNEQARFNLIYKPEKFKSYSVKALSFVELINRWHYFRATRRQAQRKSGLKFQIEEVRGNEVHKLGEFRVHLQLQTLQAENFMKTESQHLNPQLQDSSQKKLKIQERQFKETKQTTIQKLLHPVTKFLIGTIDYTVQNKKVSQTVQDK